MIWNKEYECMDRDNLKDLQLAENQISDISPLGHLVNLESLALNDNLLSDITTLQYHDNLKRLYLSDNCIIDFSPVVHVTFDPAKNRHPH